MPRGRAVLKCGWAVEPRAGKGNDTGGCAIGQAVRYQQTRGGQGRGEEVGGTPHSEWA